MSHHNSDPQTPPVPPGTLVPDVDPGAALQQADVLAARQYIDLLFTDDPADDERIVLVEFRDNKVRVVPCRTREEAAKYANGRTDVYCALALQPASVLINGRRGGNDTATGIVGFGVDVDAEKEGHNYPPTKQVALDLSRSFPVRPTVVVDSGGGYHLHFLLKELLRFDDEQERARAAQMLKALGSRFRAHFETHGYELDFTHDLARILRVPGTRNSKRDGHIVGIVEVNESQRWGSLDDLADAFGIDPSGAEAAISGAEVRLAGDLATLRARFPQENHEALEATKPLYKARFGRDATGLKKNSPSDIDLSIGSLTKAAGWSDEERGAAIVCSREAYNVGWEHHPDPVDYVRRTLEKSNDGARQAISRARPRKPYEFHRTDTGNAELFAQENPGVCFDHTRGRFFIYDKHWWDEDAVGGVVQRAQQVARKRGREAFDAESLTEAEKKKQIGWALQSEQRPRIEATLALAKSQPGMANTGTNWDSDPDLVAVSNGVIDTRTGDIRPGRLDDYMKSHIPVAYDRDARCPRWIDFLDEVQGGDAEMIDFIRRAVGYSITGHTSEQCLFLLHGAGANGKSVFLNVVRTLAGAYGANTPFTTLEMKGRAQIPNDVAALAGRRLVTASETAEGIQLNEPRVKAMTGCDPIAARFLHQEWFEYTPMFKIWLGVNHKPQVKDDSHGFWRRMRVIPFLQQFSGEGDDKHLEEKLWAELPGILTWAIEGCLDWRRHGLEPPETIKAAVEEYREESDPLAPFLEEICVVGPDFTAKAGLMFKAYQWWADDLNIPRAERVTHTVFGALMKKKFRYERTARLGRHFVGVGLIGQYQHGLPEPPPPQGG